MTNRSSAGEWTPLSDELFGAKYIAWEGSDYVRALIGNRAGKKKNVVSERGNPKRNLKLSSDTQKWPGPRPKIT